MGPRVLTSVMLLMCESICLLNQLYKVIYVSVVFTACYDVARMLSHINSMTLVKTLRPIIYCT